MVAKSPSAVYVKFVVRFVSSLGPHVLAELLDDELLVATKVSMSDVRRPASSNTVCATVPIGSVDWYASPRALNVVDVTSRVSERAGIVDDRFRAVPPFVP
jgi:hypothetical protein